MLEIYKKLYHLQHVVEKLLNIQDFVRVRLWFVFISLLVYFWVGF